jgi:hypothetical protein
MMRAMFFLEVVGAENGKSSGTVGEFRHIQLNVHRQGVLITSNCLACVMAPDGELDITLCVLPIPAAVRVSPVSCRWRSPSWRPERRCSRS